MDANNYNVHGRKIEVSLPDGSIVDITTKEGANAFLNGVSSTDHIISSKLKEIRMLRKKKRLNARDEDQLKGLSVFILSLSTADQDIYRAKIPQSEIQHLLDYIIEEFKSFTEKRSWISTGLLRNDDFRVLHLCCGVLTASTNVVLLCLAFESEFFQVLASFIKARKGHGGRSLPDATVCDCIGEIAFFTSVTANRKFDNSWSTEKVLKKFEASGILEQFLRCSTLAQPYELRSAARNESPYYFQHFLKDLGSCAGLLARKFKSGEPCGDTLKAILDGRDGSRNIHPKIFNQLQGIARLVETMDSKEFKAAWPFSKCGYCFKDGDDTEELCRCGGCRVELYCSTECQKADWKRHKFYCRKMTKPERDRAISVRMATLRFLNQNFETLFEELDKKCDSTGLEASDLVVEIDFMPNEDGIIPALCEPPIFKIAPIRDYISGQEIPEWLRRARFSDNERASIMLESVCESTSAVLLLNHADLMYTDNKTIEQFRQTLTYE